jgi:tetratricopeptide (TPR) repeat protein
MHNRNIRVLAIALIALMALMLSVCAGPSEAEWNYNEGVRLQAQGHHQQAANMYGLAIGGFRQGKISDTLYVYANINRAIARHHLGIVSDANSDIARAFDLDPEFARSYITRSVVYTNLNSPAANIFYIVERGFTRRSSGTGPEASAIYNNESLMFLHSDRTPLSMANLIRAIDLDPQNAIAWSNRAALHLILDEPVKALEYVNEAIRLSPGIAKSHANRALINTVLGNDNDSQQDMKNAETLCLDPIRLRIGVAMLKQIP